MWITWGIIFYLIIFTFVHTNYKVFKYMIRVFEKDKLKSNPSAVFWWIVKLYFCTGAFIN